MRTLRRTRALGNWLFACAAFLASGRSPAHAQVCHAGGLGVEDGWAASVQLREATVRDGALSADYLGAALGVGFAVQPVEASVSVPGYRLDDGNDVHTGLGDVLVDGRLALWSGVRSRHHGDRLKLGVEFAAALPTGDHDVGLGMGHVMAIPGVFARVRDHRVAALVQVGYGRALASAGHAAAHAGDGAHAGHGVHAGVASESAGIGSIVDPMSDSEIEAALTFSVDTSEHFGLDATVAAAAPVATETGTARGVAGLGLHAAFGLATPALLIELPWLGAPFTHKVTATVTFVP
jgi:hypothetical protein